MKTIYIFISVIFCLVVSGCTLYPSNILVEEPAGGYAFEMPADWEEISPTDDMFSKDGDVVVYTSVGNPSVSQTTAATIIVVRNIDSAPNAFSKFITAVDWDFAKVVSSTKIEDGSTSLPTTVVQVNVGDSHIFDSHVFQMEPSTYAIVFTLDDSSDIKQGYEKILNTFRTY